MPCQEEMLSVRRTKIQLLKGGTGDPLLYLHSAGGEVAWLPFFVQLAPRYTVYVPAHPGFNKSAIGYSGTMRTRAAVGKAGRDRAGVDGGLWLVKRET